MQNIITVIIQPQTLIAVQNTIKALNVYSLRFHHEHDFIWRQGLRRYIGLPGNRKVVCSFPSSFNSPQVLRCP